MARNHLLISYDVSDDKRRTQVFEALKDHGDHLQFSVFLCQLDRAELAELRGRLAAAIHHGEDQVIFVDLGPAKNDPVDLIETLGRGLEPRSRSMIV